MEGSEKQNCAGFGCGMRYSLTRDSGLCFCRKGNRIEATIMLRGDNSKDAEKHQSNVFSINLVVSSDIYE